MARRELVERERSFQRRDGGGEPRGLGRLPELAVVAMLGAQAGERQLVALRERRAPRQRVEQIAERGAATRCRGLQRQTRLRSALALQPAAART
jgi:hypothetical protein